MQVSMASLSLVCLSLGSRVRSNRVNAGGRLPPKSSANSCQGLPCACRLAGMGATTAAAGACTQATGNTGSGRSVMSLPRGQVSPLQGVLIWGDIT